jgi:hypothetical protein
MDRGGDGKTRERVSRRLRLIRWPHRRRVPVKLPGVVHRRRILLVAVFLLLFVGGCGPFVDPYNLQDLTDQPAAVLGGGATVGQTFTAHDDGLSAIDLQVAVYPTIPRTTGTLVVSLWRVPSSIEPGAIPSIGSDHDKPLAVQQFPEATLEPNQWIRFSFAPITDSRGKTFFLRAETTDPGKSPVTLWATGHLIDEGNSRFVNARAVPGSLAFRIYHDESPSDVVAETVATIGRSPLLWPIALLLCLVPGLGTASLLSRQDTDPAAFLGLAIGWSVLLGPLALTLATPIRFGPAMGLVLLVVGTLLFVSRWPRLELSPWAALAIGATGVAVVIRAVDAKGLIAPMWGDPVQHSYVAQLIGHDKGVPATYGALVPSQVFDYHFGFQAMAASASWLSGANAADAVLAVGQVLDALICLALYRFARDLVGSPVAGAVAAVLVAMVTTQPTYFVTWGRYPELAALVALPAAAAALRSALRETDGDGSPIGSFATAHTICDLKTRTSRLTPRFLRHVTRGVPDHLDRIVVAAVAASALVVVHPRVGVFLGCLGLAFAAADSLERRRLRSTGLGFLRLAAVGLVSLAMLVPWTVRLWHAHYHQVIATFAWQPVDFPLGLAIAGNDRWVLELAIAGAVVCLARRPALFVLFGLWSGLVFVLANPATFHLPFNLFINNGSVAIALFVPASVLVGYLASSIATTCGLDTWAKGVQWGLVGAIFLLGCSQAPALTTVVNPCCLLIRPGDTSAIDWVRQNTPPDAKFVINGYQWMNDIWMGSDAGYWLPVLAQRRTSLPPLFYGVAPADEVREINATAASVSHDASDPAALANLAARIGARYVFIGTRGGALDPGELKKSDLFQVDYEGGGAWVFEVRADDPTSSNVTVTGITPSPSAPPRD